MYRILYNIFLLLYRASLQTAAIWNPKAAKWVNGRKNLPELIKQKIPGGKKLVWMHCASLGEFEQGRPVIERLRTEKPEIFLVVSFFSPSGYEVCRNYSQADLVTYLPFGTWSDAERFISLLNPSLVLWIKYDYWFQYLQPLRDQNIPLLLISAIFRKEQKIFKWYGSLNRRMLRCFTQLYVQDQQSADQLKKIGISKNVTVSGDTRFDRVVSIASQASAYPEIENFIGHHPVIIAGSTWPEDEEELDHYVNTHPEIRFIVAPHETEEPHLREMEQLFRHTIRYSELKRRWAASIGDIGKNAPGMQGSPGQNEQNCLIIDNVGMLSHLYRYATICYIGGGFGEAGVHNVLEAAVFGKPVVFGPVFDKFKEAIDLLNEEAAFTVESALELEKTFNDLFSDKDLYTECARAASSYVSGKTGASTKILDDIGTYL